MDFSAHVRLAHEFYVDCRRIERLGVAVCRVPWYLCSVTNPLVHGIVTFANDMVMNCTVPSYFDTLTAQNRTVPDPCTAGGLHKIVMLVAVVDPVIILVMNIYVCIIFTVHNNIFQTIHKNEWHKPVIQMLVFDRYLVLLLMQPPPPLPQPPFHRSWHLFVALFVAAAHYAQNFLNFLAVMNDRYLGLSHDHHDVIVIVTMVVMVIVVHLLWFVLYLVDHRAVHRVSADPGTCNICMDAVDECEKKKMKIILT